MPMKLQDVLFKEKMTDNEWSLINFVKNQGYKINHNFNDDIIQN